MIFGPPIIIVARFIRLPAIRSVLFIAFSKVFVASFMSMMWDFLIPLLFSAEKPITCGSAPSSTVAVATATFSEPISMTVMVYILLFFNDRQIIPYINHGSLNTFFSNYLLNIVHQKCIFSNAFLCRNYIRWFFGKMQFNYCWSSYDKIADLSIFFIDIFRL